VSAIVLGSTFIRYTSQGQTSPHSPLHRSRGPTSSQGGSTNPAHPPQGSVTQNTHTMARTNPSPPPQMPYLASINIPYLTKLTNDPILHNPTWPAMPTKLPSDIPKFEGKSRDDLANHIMTFHLCYSSNNITDYSIRLRLFKCTLTGPSTKWYVEEKFGSHVTFESLAKAFLTFFQLPIHHDNGSNYSRNLNKPLLFTSLTTFTNGVSDVAFAKLKLLHNNVSIGSSNHLFPSPKTWPPPSPNLKNNPLERPNSSNSFNYS
jgi:hypothetical protein